MSGLSPLSMGFFRQEYWSGLPFPSPGDLPNPGIEPGSPALQADLYHLSHQGSDKEFPCQYRRYEFNPWVGKIPWRRERQPTPIFFPGKSHEQRSLAGYSPWDCKESNVTEQLHFHFSLPCIGEGNGNPLQCSCLENPRMVEPDGLPSMGSHRVGHD